MAASQMSLLASGLLLVSFLRCSSPSPPCPQPCVCRRAPLLNCSSSGLTSVPRLTQDSVTELDLSHNLLGSVSLCQPRQKLRSMWLGNNSITYLSLCVERNPGDRYRRHRPGTGSRARCLTWAPALQLLSAEKNLLEQLPEGLDGVKSLQVLQLSFNRISTLQPGALSNLKELKELHLHHNLLTHLHPQMFQDLDQLRVLDMSFNMLTSLHPVMYLTLRSIGTDVGLDGNRWQCNCSMHRLQRMMVNDSSRGLQIWSIVCSSPAAISGRDLLHLEEKDLKCLNTENKSDLHQDVMVYSGSGILLPCSVQGSIWWTPRGQASVSHHNAGLLISNFSERDTGLYVCVSEEDQVLSVFNLQISKPGGARKPRSLPKLSLPQAEKRSQNTTHPDLALAVCLSIFITFLIAFIVGVLARPCIDSLWKRVTNKKSTPAANSVSTVEQRQYVNEAFSSAEEPEDPGHVRERRVTFSTVDFIEENNVQYYDTVASGDQDSISSDAVFEGQVLEAERYKQAIGESESEHLPLRRSEDKQSDDSDSGDSNEQRIQNMEFEHIPDPDELGERRSLSSCSDSSLSEKVSGEEHIAKKKPTKSKSPKLVEDLVQQRPNLASEVAVTQISIEGKSENPRLSSRSFDDCLLHTNKTNPSDSDVSHENDLFEFSDSVESPTARSGNVFDSLHKPKQTLTSTSDKQKMEDMSSSSSYISENEPTHYTVNSDPDSEQDVRYGVQSQRVDPVKNSYDTKSPAGRPHYTSSSDSSETNEDSMQNKRKQKTYRKEITDLKAGHHRSRIKDRSDVRAQTLPSDFSSSDESTNQEISDMQNQRMTTWTRVPVSQPKTPYSSTQWPSVDLKHIPRIKRRLDIKGPSPRLVSSSSSDSEDEKVPFKKQEQQEVHVSRPPIKVSQTVTKEPENQWPAIDLRGVTRIKRRLDVKAPSPRSDSFSSSDSEDEATKQIQKPAYEELHVSRPPIKVSQTVTKEPENQWPAIDLRGITQIKRQLDIKGPSTKSDSSSSSDSEDEKVHIKKQEQQEVHVSRPPIKVSQTVTKEPENQWPAIDLRGVTRIKRRLDIKGPSTRSDSSSSSDSEDEATKQIQKPVYEELHVSRPPIKVSQTVTKEPENQWPASDLRGITQIKRRLDVKAPLPRSDSSSSSDSEDEKVPIKKQEQQEVHVSIPPIKVSQTVTKEPENQWPAIDLRGVTRIKRRLDVKAPSPRSDSSSSSDSEDEKVPIKKQEQQEVHVSRPQIKVSQTVTKEPENQWPAIDLRGITQIKRRLDVKAPSPRSDSSSSSDSEDEKVPIKKQEQQEVHVSRPPIKVSQTVTKEPENQWPAIVLERVTQIKRRLDIKASSPRSDSSSSSDSENEATKQIQKPVYDELHVSRPPIKVSQTVTKEPENQWPALNHEQVTRIKRRLDIKGPSPINDLSSSEATGHFKKQEQNDLHVLRPGMETSDVLTTFENKFKQSPEVLVMDISHAPKKDHNIILEKYTAVSEDLQNQPTSNTISSTPEINPEINPELQTRWATMNLGISRFRRRLEITSPTTKPPNLPSSPLPDSPHSSSNESVPERRTRLQRRIVGMQELVYTDSSCLPENTPVNVSPTLKDPHNKFNFLAEAKSSVTENETKPDQAIKRYRDTWVDEKASATASQHYPHSSSSSDSEDKTIDPSVPDLSLSVPRIQRHLNIKAPSQELSNTQSFFSKNEKGVSKYSEMQSRQTILGTADESLITYKRSIIKSSSLPKNSFSQTVDQTFIAQENSYRNTSHAPRLSPNMSFDNIVKGKIRQPRSNTDVDLLPEIKWMRVGHHLSDRSTFSPAGLNAMLPSLQQASLAEPQSLPLEATNSTSGIDKMQDSGKLDETLLNKYSSLGSEGASFSDSFDLLGISPHNTNEKEDKRENKGLNALKVMSLERKLWEGDLSKDPFLLSDDYSSQDDSNFMYNQSEKDSEIPSNEPLRRISSSSMEKKRDADLFLLYGVPRYIRHDFKAPMQETPPPPVPETPLPDD
ncbi:uncharacterized protein LOC108240194 [Kryptolebias marmoratus]|uniref:Leucine rich repeat containing 66 n=1 Tax=Kryptolebias marmoratus TaxID=37003 RepID=A0A3Q3AZM5_KRYMA|nr:uncharacterized protein LOC108240194 [Kryptolebias marmoratus]